MFNNIRVNNVNKSQSIYQAQGKNVHCSNKLHFGTSNKNEETEFNKAFMYTGAALAVLAAGVGIYYLVRHGKTKNVEKTAEKAGEQVTKGSNTVANEAQKQINDEINKLLQDIETKIKEILPENSNEQTDDVTKKVIKGICSISDDINKNINSKHVFCKNKQAGIIPTEALNNLRTRTQLIQSIQGRANEYSKNKDSNTATWLTVLIGYQKEARARSINEFLKIINSNGFDSFEQIVPLLEECIQIAKTPPYFIIEDFLPIFKILKSKQINVENLEKQVEQILQSRKKSAEVENQFTQGI